MPTVISKFTSPQPASLRETFPMPEPQIAAISTWGRSLNPGTWIPRVTPPAPIIPILIGSLYLKAPWGGQSKLESTKNSACPFAARNRMKNHGGARPGAGVLPEPKPLPG